MAQLTAGLLWLPRLSMTAMSPDFSVGISSSST
jgi:hypothetical protein